MRIIAFIIDHDVVDAILRHLAKAEARSAEHGSSLHRFLSLMSVVAGCAGFARGGGNGTGDRGSRALFRVTRYRPPAPDDSEDRPTRASPLWDPKRRPNTVFRPPDMPERCCLRTRG